jgi:DNA-binding MarR family transcriptional regulator
MRADPTGVAAPSARRNDVSGVLTVDIAPLCLTHSDTGRPERIGDLEGGIGQWRARCNRTPSSEDCWMCSNDGLLSAIVNVVDDVGLAETIRGFNRFYTEAIGALNERHEGLTLSLAQSRVLFTVASTIDAQVNEIAAALQIDLAYTSRVLGSLEDRKLVRRTISPLDRRQRVVRLTAQGRRVLAQIEQRSNKRALALVGHLDDDQLTQLLDAMNTIKTLITKDDDA